MASNGRQKVVVSRRRREDEGEEEGSVLADLEDDSLSEGSIISNGDDDADIEPSDISEDEEVTKVQHNERGPPQPNSSLPIARHLEKVVAQVTDSSFVTSSDTKAMLNGLRQAEGMNVSTVEFGEATINAPEPTADDRTLQKKVEAEAPAERSRREHLEYLKQKKENPAFVPNRGGFFLHDNRAAPSGPNGFRTYPRGRGRGGFNGFQPRYVLLLSFSAQDIII